MAKATIRIKLLSGPEFGFDTATYMCVADRVAFERHFKISTGTLAAAADRPGDEAAPRISDEWVAFFTWRSALRDAVGFTLEFEPFLDDVEAIAIEETDEPDPTVPDPPTT